MDRFKPMESDINLLLALAIAAKKNAYSPISNYSVGAAVLTAEGKYFSGCNVESATLTATTHAENNAIDAMVLSGERSIKKILVVTNADDPVFPCGLCRQKILEFGKDAEVIAATFSGKLATTTIGELYPRTFTLIDIGK